MFNFPWLNKVGDFFASIPAYFGSVFTPVVGFFTDPLVLWTLGAVGVVVLCVQLIKFFPQYASQVGVGLLALGSFIAGGWYFRKGKTGPIQKPGPKPVKKVKK